MLRMYATLVILAVFIAWGSAQSPRCEKIITPTCQRLGYNTTLMPNFVGHTDIQQAIRGLQAFQPLLHYNCSQHLRLFVCSVFIPLCSEYVPGAVPACQGLCEEVRQDCLPVLEKFHLPWPAELDCARFPQPPALCMQVPPNEDIHHFQINRSLLSADMSISLGDSLCPPRFASVEDTCSPHCGVDAYYRKEDKMFTQLWTITWASLSLLITAFTLLTFCIDRSRFRYPERPILFMSLCCFLYSLFILLRISIGANVFICSNGSLTTITSENMLCALSAFVTRYLEMTICLWWLIFCVCWYFHATCEWSNESLSEMASWFHGTVYGISIIPPLLALLTGNIVADELTESCVIKEEASIYFIVIPQSLCLAIGVLLFVRIAFSLVHIRRSLLATGRGASKLERLMIRLGLFTVLFVLLELCYLACTIYESWHRPWWKSLALLSALDCPTHRTCNPEPMYRTASIEVVLLRILFTLLFGISSLMWVCSGKTCRTWGQIIHAPRKLMPVTKV